MAHTRHCGSRTYAHLHRPQPSESQTTCGNPKPTRSRSAATDTYNTTRGPPGLRSDRKLRQVSTGMAIRRGTSYAVAALFALASVAAAVAGEVFFQEKFEGDY